MRLTREKDTFPCRLNCQMEEYLVQLFDIDYFELDRMMSGKSVCSNCPMMEIANKLANYEDKYE